jgi:hypothetical protein
LVVWCEVVVGDVLLHEVVDVGGEDVGHGVGSLLALLVLWYHGLFVDTPLWWGV